MPWKPDYITAAEFNGWARNSDTVDDVETALWITAASRAVDEHCKRQFGQMGAVTARVYRRAPWWDAERCLWIMDIDDVQDTAGMLINGVALASAGAVLLPDNAPGEGVPYTMLGWATDAYASPWPAAGYMTHTARWGWSAVPSQVKAVTRLQTNRFTSRRDSPYGTTEAPDGAAPLRLAARLDPDLAVALRGLGRAREAL